MNKHRLFIQAILGIVAITSAIGLQARTPASLAAPAKKYAAQLSNGVLLFTENKGQVADVKGHLQKDVLFTAHSGNTRIFLKQGGIQYQFTKSVAGKTEASSLNETHLFGVQLAGANLHATIRTEEPGLLKENFYLAHCPEGITGAATFGRIVYENVYPGIDWVIYSKGEHLEYDFVVKPDGNPKDIRLQVNGADQTAINAAGELVMKTSLGEVKEHAPLSFAGGKKVVSHFVKHTDGSIGFAVNQPAGQTLTIDPFVEWATYFGGANVEATRNSAADTAGNIYVSGYTNSTSGVAATGHQLTYGGGTYDAFLIKFDAAGNRKWATYYGGTGTDYGYSCAVTPAGDAVYLTGITSSSTAGAISTTGAFQVTSGGGNEGYLVRFDSTGVRQWGTYYGGSGSDNVYSCAVDAAGNPYIAGYTASTAGIASTGAYQTTNSGASDAFLVKFNPAGARQWGTYFGGALEDRAFTCVANGGNIYLTGYTASTSGIATTGTQQTVFGTGSYDIFIAQFDTLGTRKWGTYYGGTGSDYALGSAAFNGGLYLSGYTSSASAVLTTTGAYQTTSGGSFEAVLARFDTTGNRVWSTFFGGAGADYGYGCSVNPQGDVYFSGFTTSTAAIASGGAQNTLGGGVDAYVAKFSPAGDRIWSSYFGGALNDTAYSCVATNGAVYIPGTTGSIAGIATANAYQTANAGNNDVFIARLSDPTLTLGAVSAATICTGTTLAVPYTSAGTFAAGNTFTVQLSDSSGSFTTPVSIGSATAADGTITATIPAGTIFGASYRVRIIASNPEVITANNGVNISINSKPATPSPIIGSGNVCGGSPETYFATAVPNSTSYTWTLPATWTGASTTDTIHTTAGASGGNITVTANNSCGSSAPATLAVTISTLVSPGAIVTASDTVICAGELVSFAATAINGGTAPSYQWKRNGVNVGTNSNSYTDASLNNQDTVYVVITSNSLCVNTPSATSNKKLIQVDPVQNPSVTITAAPGTTVPGNQTITFTATAANAGTNPAYQWYVSGSAIAGATGSTLTLTGLAEGDSVSVRVRRIAGGNYTCSTTDSAMSPALTIHIVLGVGNVNTASAIRLYPNPSTGLLTLSGKLNANNSGKEYSVDVCNAIGQIMQQVVFKPSADAWSQDIHLGESLANGLYYLCVRIAGEQKVIPFSLNR